MPCSDGYGPAPSIDRVSAARADTNARVACEALKVLENAMGKSFVERTLSSSARAWWNAHKEADRIRERRETEARARQALKDSAVSKLTPEERKALGV